MAQHVSHRPAKLARSGRLVFVSPAELENSGRFAVVRSIDGRVRLSASDVANFLACRHLTRLDLLHARGIISPPRVFDAGFDDLVKRGEAHEKEVLQGFRARGLQVVEIPESQGNVAAGAHATRAAMSSGVDVIYQGVLTREPAGGQPALLGFPDFLVRAELIAAPDGEPRPRPSGGSPSYEVVDAKLARTAKGRAVAQTAFYSQLLAELQGGFTPRWLHLALGTGELASFKVNDFAAYERQTRRLLTEFVEADTGTSPPLDTYPEPVEHCAICRWSDSCAARRRADDDLSLVAGISRGQRRALKAVGVETRRGLAGLDPVPPLRGTSRESVERARSQANLQVRSEDAGSLGYELLAPAVDADGALVGNRGLLALPQPVTGDLFFDIEGARYYSEDGREFGLQYLFGIVDTADVDAAGAPRYRQFWAFDRTGEKRAFEELIDFVMARRRERPGLHVYHYNHYETTAVDHLSELHETRQEAVGRLMGRFATREDEVDELFRLGVFVDLYRVVRQGLQAGVESYSIKRLEPLCGYSRVVRLRDATQALVSFEVALDSGSGASEAVLQEVVAGYNEDDCRATLSLRDWLEALRPELAGKLGLDTADLPRPVVPQSEAEAEDSEVTRLRSALMSSVPAQQSSRTPEEAARALLADLLEWHRRENKPQWWRYFYVRTLSPLDLVAEPDALGLLTGGEVFDSVKRSVLRRFSFPPQEHKFAPLSQAEDPITGRGFTVESVDDGRSEIALRMSKDYDGPLPSALVQGGPPSTKLQAERMRDLGSRVLADGLTGLDAGTALLLRRAPADASAEPVPLRSLDESAQEAAVRIARALGNSYLPIQGPPGTGKTHTAAEQILALIAEGRTVGITGPSHAVIHNLITKVFERAAASRAAAPRVGQRADKDNPFLHAHADRLQYPQLTAALADGDLDVAAGTTWMWSRPEFQGSVDTLFIDEAGQMSLADALAVASAARNLVLLGDPQQLAQPSQAAHPPGSGVSALEHILGERATMPSDAGLLIDKTWRMHPDLCRFTSRTFYDGKLTGVDGLELQEILADPPPSGAGLRVIEVPHEGNTNASPEEAAVVADLVRNLLDRQWRNRFGELAPIGVEQVVVVTPYNAQIRAIQSAAAAAGLPRLQAGTVDKFQGREAPVVIYSMATSSADDAPRGMEFLYDLHRLNVATSRARALAIIVASPDLVRVACQTPRQMHLANALCRAWQGRVRTPEADMSAEAAPRGLPPQDSAAPPSG
jgi:predicted RecB family nuclease